MGRDYLARCIYGGRASLLVGFLSMVLSTALGVIIGSISGFVGGTVDAVLMRLVDALMSLPTFLIMIVMNAFLKPGLQNIVLIIGFLTWMNIARIVRGETISLNEREYVIYAKISGQKKFSTHDLTVGWSETENGFGGYALSASGLSYDPEKIPLTDGKACTFYCLCLSKVCKERHLQIFYFQ